MIVLFTFAMYLLSSYFYWILTALILSSYPVLHLVFYKNGLYKQLDFNTKMYVISQRIQSVVEFLLLPYIVSNWGWNNEAIRRAALVYSAPHTAAVVMCSYPYVESLKHGIIIVLALIYQREDFDSDTAARCGVIYACFSCLLFWVQYVLAEKRMRRVRTNSADLLSVCACNWIWQLWYLLNRDMNLWGILWVSCLVVLVNNDVIMLNRWVEV
jgi:hypothetical protein